MSLLSPRSQWEPLERLTQVIGFGMTVLDILARVALGLWGSFVLPIHLYCSVLDKFIIIIERERERGTHMIIYTDK